MRLVIHVKLAPNDIKNRLYWIGCTTTVHSQCTGAVRNQMRVHKSKTLAYHRKKEKLRFPSSHTESQKKKKKEQLRILEPGFYFFKHAIIVLYPNNPPKT